MAAEFFQVVQGDQGGDHGVHDAFEDFRALVVEDRRVGHQVADVAHQHERPAGQGQRAAVGGRVVPVRVQAAFDGLVGLAEFGVEIALHQPQPVAVYAGFFFRVDGGHGVFAVLDGGDGGFQHDIADSGGVVFADGVFRVDADFDVQAVVLEQQGVGGFGVAVVSGELGRGVQGGRLAAGQEDFQSAVEDGVTMGGGVRAFSQGQGFVQEPHGVGDYAGAASGVVAHASFTALGFTDHIGAVEGVV